MIYPYFFLRLYGYRYVYPGVFIYSWLEGNMQSEWYLGFGSFSI